MLFKCIKGVARCTFGTVVEAIVANKEDDAATVAYNEHLSCKEKAQKAAREVTVTAEEATAQLVVDVCEGVTVPTEAAFDDVTEVEAAPVVELVAGEAHSDVRIVEVDDGFEARQVRALIMAAGILVCHALFAAARFVAYTVCVVGK